MRVRIRDGFSLEVEQEARVHDQPLTGVAWHPSLPLLATAATDGLIRIWDLKTWDLREEIRTGELRGWELQVSPGGGRLLARIPGSKLSVFEPRCFQH